MYDFLHGRSFDGQLYVYGIPVECEQFVGVVKKEKKRKNLI